MLPLFADLERRLDRRGGTFLYKQIKALLREKVERAELKPGDPIPPMRELSRRCRVSELTVRRAIQELAQEGVLSSRPGSGTFVLDAPLPKARTPGEPEPLPHNVHDTDIGVAFANIAEGYPLFEQFVKGMRSVVGDRCLLQFFEQPVDTRDAAIQAGRFPIRQISGLVVFAPINLELVSRCRRESVPCILMFPSVTEGQGPCVIVDYESGMTDAMLHLHDRGRDRIAFVSSGPHLWSTSQYVNAYRTGLKWLKLESLDDWLIHAGHDELAGFEATRTLLAQEPRPDAIIYGTDFAAKGGIHALGQAGLRVPKDVAVIGMGNALRPMESAIELTTLDIKVHEEGRVAASVLMRLVRNEPDVPLETMIAPELIVRATT